MMSPLHFIIQEHTLPCQYIREYPGATLDDQEDTLYLHIKQYKPKDQSCNQLGAVTLIGAHANAFPKVCPLVIYISMNQALTLTGTLRVILG